jgi:hypothetical protein
VVSAGILPSLREGIIGLEIETASVSGALVGVTDGKDEKFCL